MGATNEAPVVAPSVRAGQAVYSLPFLRAWYDVVVFRLNNPLVWRCPTRELLAHYRRHVSGNHLEAGVGSGYLLDRCGLGASAPPRLVLVDLNESCLATSARRLARYRPEVLRRNLLAPLGYDGPRFDSIGLNYVLHCLPGTLPEKAVALDHLGALLAPGGVLFGATLLADAAAAGRLARGVGALFNRAGIFCNAGDTRADLERALTGRFREVSIRSVGCAALFAARGRRA